MLGSSGARLPRRRCVAGVGAAVLLASLSGTPAAAGIQATLDTSVARDDYNLSTTHFGAELAQGGPDLGWRLRGRWYVYSLDRDLVGIRSFSGAEPAAELGAHWLSGSWWLSGTAGLQGTLSSADAVGNVVLARALALDEGTLTPRVDVGRRPLALSSLPLSLGLKAYGVEGALAWRSPGWIGELAGRVDWWDATTVEGRVENPALATIPANRRTLASAYLISQGCWLQGGLLAKVQNGQRNTLLATQTTPDYAYTWYPISMPVWAWEAAAIGRVTGRPFASLQALLQVQIPFVSREMRQWEWAEQWAWGTAAWEAKAELTWDMTETAQVTFGGVLFAKPWSNWDVSGGDGYRQISLQAGITQRL